MIAGTKRRDFTVEIYNFDRTMAPPGRTVVKVMFPVDYAYWSQLHQDSQRYEAEKEKVAEQVIALLDGDTRAWPARWRCVTWPRQRPGNVTPATGRAASRAG